MMVDINKKYQTRDGRAVRILCVDGPKHDYPIIGILGGTEHAHTWKADGRNDFGAGNLDLIPVPERYEGWVSLDCDDFCVFSSKEEAEEDGAHGIHTLVAHVTWED